MELPDDAYVILRVGSLRRWAGKQAKEEPFDGVGTNEASEITGLEPRTLRRMWHQWERIQHDGGRPEIRVSRKTSAPRSDKLYDRTDCLAWRRNHGGGPRRMPEPPQADDGPDILSDPNNVEAIVDRLYGESFGDG